MIIAAIPHVVGRQIHLSLGLLVKFDRGRVLRLGEGSWKVVEQLKAMFVRLAQLKSWPFHLCSKVYESCSPRINR